MPLSIRENEFANRIFLYMPSSLPEVGIGSVQQICFFRYVKVFYENQIENHTFFVYAQLAA